MIVSYVFYVVFHLCAALVPWPQDEYEADDVNLEPTERLDADDEFNLEEDVEDVSQLEIVPRRLAGRHAGLAKDLSEGFFLGKHGMGKYGI